MRFSVLLCCYGNFPEYSLRAIQSVLNCSNKSSFDFHVGCNICGEKTITTLRNLYDTKKIDTLIEMNENINRDQTMRLLIERSRTEYALSMDDDSHVLPGWDIEINNFIENNKPFDAAGQLFVAARYPEYKELSKKRPWWKEIESNNDVYFPVGGLFLFRIDFMRQHNFPDRGMIRNYGDMFFGDLLKQQNGMLKILDEKVMSKIKINDGKRRGVG